MRDACSVLWTFLVTPVAAAALKAWALMLLVGAVHGEWFPSLPTLGYWQAAAIAGPVVAIACLWAAVVIIGKALAND